MSITAVQRLLKRQPFEPFVVEMSDGSSYEVLRPDQVFLAARAIYVGLPPSDDYQVAQDVAICDLLRITRLVPLAGRARKNRRRKR